MQWDNVCYIIMLLTLINQRLVKYHCTIFSSIAHFFAGYYANFHMGFISNATQLCFLPLQSFMANKTHLPELCWVVSLLWQHPPALWYEIITSKLVSTGLFSPGLTQRWGLSAFGQVFPLQEKKSETKHLQILPWPGDGLGVVWSCEAAGRFSKGNIFPPSFG